jgi:hypothetical protein
LVEDSSFKKQNLIKINGEKLMAVYKLTKEEMVKLGFLNPGPDSTTKKVLFKGKPVKVKLLPSYSKGT